MDIPMFTKCGSERLHFKLCSWILLFMVVCNAFVASRTLHPKDLPEFPMSTDSCSKYDTCEAHEFFRTCSCEEDCFRYGICCWDVLGKPSESVVQEEFMCYKDKVPIPVYTKKTCSQDFRGDAVIKASCESVNPKNTDLMSQVLVTSNRTSTTYYNWNCAICNNENATDLVFWTVQATCSHDAGDKRVEVTKVRNEIKFHEDLQQWGVYNEGEFFSCPLTFFQPPSLVGRVKHCIADMVSDCPEDWVDYKVRHNCISHYAERNIFGTGKYYRNVYCAICNGLTPSDLHCSGRSSYRPVMGRSDARVMKVVFNLNPWSGEYSLGQQLECPADRVYDPFLKTCRTTECGLVDPTEDKEFCKSDRSGSARRNVHPFVLCFLTLFGLLRTSIKS